MTVELITGHNSRWSVLWLVKKPGRKPYMIEHECGSDLVEAMRLRDLAIKADKRFVTLRSMNVGFPPPEKYRPHYETIWTGKYKIVKRKVKMKKKVKRKNGSVRWKVVTVEKKFRKKVTTERWVVPMELKNALDEWWCPYCMKFRRFELRDGYAVNEVAYHCQICNISSRDWHVRKWNPMANRFYSHPPRRSRRSNGRKSRRRRS